MGLLVFLLRRASYRRFRGPRLIDPIDCSSNEVCTFTVAANSSNEARDLAQKRAEELQQEDASIWSNPSLHVIQNLGKGDSVESRVLLETRGIKRD